MAVLPENVVTKVTSDAAEAFTDSYYAALQSARQTISSHYVPRQILPDGKVVPTIIWNGHVIESADIFQKMFEERMPYTHFDVQSLDCHVLNSTALAVAPEKPKDAERSMSMTVSVSGSVRLEEPHRGPMRAFSETFVLVPNLENFKSTARGGPKAWLIQSQIFRYVV